MAFEMALGVGVGVSFQWLSNYNGLSLTEVTKFKKSTIIC
jgi:hypothetical protein